MATFTLCSDPMLQMDAAACSSHAKVLDCRKLWFHEEGAQGPLLPADASHNFISGPTSTATSSEAQ